MENLNRINKVLSKLKKSNKTALITYITAGDPHPSMTLDLMHLLVAQGADILEIGVPFSDPLADGPIIQKATERALKHNTSLTDIFEIIKQFRLTDKNTPVILMGYLNPIEALGYTIFAEKASAVGVDGVLTVDMPPEEAKQYLQALNAKQLNAIFLVSPTTPIKRLQAVNAIGSGFVYYVSLKGVTGSSEINQQDVEKQLEIIKQYINIPICIGFGINTGVIAKQLAPLADGLIVGSSLVQIIEKSVAEDSGYKGISIGLTAKMQEYKTAMISGK
jgi:tryptophan synthase alpha chain